MLNNLFDGGGDWIPAKAGMTEVVDFGPEPKADVSNQCAL